MDEEIRQRLEHDAEAGNKVAERLLLNDWLAGDHADAIDRLLDRRLRDSAQDGRLLLAELACFHAWPADQPWQEMLCECCSSGHKEALFIASIYHDWAGLGEAAALLGRRINEPDAAEDHMLWADGWDGWTPPAWETLIDRDGVAVACSSTFASRYMIGFLRSILAPQLRPSSVVDPASGQTMAHPVRINQCAQWHPEHLGWVGKLFECRLAEACGYDVANGEVLSLLHYRPGQRYKAHLDCIGTRQAESEQGQNEGGQRTMTVLLAMGNDDFTGGETHFPRLDARARAGTGELLRFNNTDAGDQPLPASLHEGTPVTTGEKWLLSKWVRKLPTPYGREICIRR